MEDAPMDAAVAGLVGACIGAVAGVSASIVVAIITRHSEDRRHLREIVLRTALEQWRESVAFGKFEVERGHGVSVFPLESFIIPMRKIADMIERDDLTPDEARKRVREYLLLSDAVADECRQHHREQEHKT
jgi:hypothetical protein